MPPISGAEPAAEDQHRGQYAHQSGDNEGRQVAILRLLFMAIN
jgi:hypothetical protein